MEVRQSGQVEEPDRDTAQLDSSFRVVSPKNCRKYYKRGRVFRILWPEPAGAIEHDRREIVRINKWSEPIAVKICWFLIVRAWKTHCVVVPVHTYNGRGVTKTGVNADDHAALVPKGQDPKLLPGESLKRSPIHFILEDQKLRLDPASRINFSKLHTIEYNVKVSTVGRVAPEDLSRLEKYWYESISKHRTEDQEQISETQNAVGPDSAQSFPAAPNTSSRQTPGELDEQSDGRQTPGHLIVKNAHSVESNLGAGMRQQINIGESHDHLQQVLNWLATVDYASSQDHLISQPQPDTGQWFIKDPKYSEWWTTPGQIMFCPGIPGAGKTMLTSNAVNDLCGRFQDDSTVGICYIYCSYQRQDESFVDMVAGLLKQLVQGVKGNPSLLGVVGEPPGMHRPKRTRPALSEISNALKSVVAKLTRTFFLIDGLDELQTTNGHRKRLLKEIFNIHSSFQVNIFATSRFIPEITETFKDSIQLEIRAHKDDIYNYLDDQMAQLPRFVTDSRERQEMIKESIWDSIDGSFLLAHLYFNSLVGKMSPKSFQIALKALANGSDTLDTAYGTSMERIENQPGDQRELAKKLLSWVVFAARPLTLPELQHALAVEVGEPCLDKDNLLDIKDVASVCAGLVRVDEEARIIRLVHYTVREYLSRSQGVWYPDAQKDMAEVCVTYLSFRDFDGGYTESDSEFEKRLKTHPFYSYAAEYWGHFAKTPPSPALLTFLESQTHVEASGQALLVAQRGRMYSHLSQQVPRGVTGLHLGAYFGCEDLVSALLDNSPADGINAIDSYGGTPLAYAAAQGHSKVVSSLLEKGAKINLKDKFNQTPLLWATWRKHETTVQLLLEKGACIDAKYLCGQKRSSQEEILRFLFGTHTSNVSQDPENSYRILLQAVRGGYEDIVRHLLHMGADLKTKDADGQTPLLLAAESGNAAIVRLLLRESVDIDGKSIHGQTPLSRAAAKGYETIARILLDQGANMESTDRFGQTPLLWATRRGHVATVRLLLEKGASLKAPNTEHKQPSLCWAVSEGYAAFLQLWLEKDVDTGSQKSTRQTALLWGEHHSVVRLLFSEDLNCQFSISHGRSSAGTVATAILKDTDPIQQLQRTVQSYILELEKAIYITREVSKAIPNGHPDRSALLNNLGGLLGEKYAKSGGKDGPADLEEAIHITQQAVQATPQDDLNQAMILNNLGSLYADKYVLSRSLADLKKAVLETLKAIETSPEDYTNRAAIFINLGSILEEQVAIFSSSSHSAKSGTKSGCEETIQAMRQMVVITDDVVKTAAGIGRNSENIITLVLKQRGDQDTIDEGVVEAAAGNILYGDGMLDLLLKQCRPTGKIPTSVFQAAARNWGKGEKVMKLLLDQYEDHIMVDQLEDVFEAAIGNKVCGDKIVALLLKKYGNTRIERVCDEAAIKAAINDTEAEIKFIKDGDLVLLRQDSGTLVNLSDSEEECMSVVSESQHSDTPLRLAKSVDWDWVEGFEEDWIWTVSEGQYSGKLIKFGDLEDWVWVEDLEEGWVWVDQFDARPSSWWHNLVPRLWEKRAPTGDDLDA